MSVSVKMQQNSDTAWLLMTEHEATCRLARGTGSRPDGTSPSCSREETGDCCVQPGVARFCFGRSSRTNSTFLNRWAVRKGGPRGDAGLKNTSHLSANVSRTQEAINTRVRVVISLGRGDRGCLSSPGWSGSWYKCEGSAAFTARRLLSL